MQPFSIHSVLNKLIALTNERDAEALELSLAQALYDLVEPAIAKSVAIYRIKDINKQFFSAIAIGKKFSEDELSSLLKQSLANCFKSGDCCVVKGHDIGIALYPLKNPTDHTIAVIVIESSEHGPRQHESIIMLLQIYQNITRLINDNERDTLTGLLNRKTFEHKLNKILAKMHAVTKRVDDKTRQLYFLTIFDIDHFKKVNDAFGHLIGDEVLLMFSQLMTQNFRDGDMLFRFGGEEFVGIFECTNAIDIERVLERFRAKVGNFEFPQVGKVTVSAGYTEISAYDASSQLIDRADVALYFAKNNGRNRICNYEQLVAEGALQENKKEGQVELF